MNKNTNPEYQLLDLIKDIESDGDWVYNERTGKNCLLVPEATFRYDCSEGAMPLPTTRFVPWKSTLKEIIGYIRGYCNANDFLAAGVKTWMANANENEAWLNNVHRKGDGDMGQAYRFRPVGYVPMIHRKESDSMEVKAKYEGEGKDAVRHIYEMLVKGEDDRGLITNAWKPETFDKSCLRPCLYRWHFTLINNKLYLNAAQRSTDVLLGLHFNMSQVFFLLSIFAHITKHEAKTATHGMVNCHIYEDQFAVLQEHKQHHRTPNDPPKLWISPEIETLEDLETFDMDKFDDYFKLTGYEPQEPINYPFSV